MSIYTNLISNVVFPLHERIKRHDSVSVRRRLEASQWWGPDTLKNFQNDRFGVFLRDIADHVPYYRALFEEMGIRAEDCTSVDTLTEIPFLTKTIIRENRSTLVASNADRLVQMNTGGSTGEPMVFMVGKERISHDVAAKWRATRWWDVDIGDSEYVIWGSPIELGKQDMVKLWRDKLLRTRLFSAFAMNDKWIDEILASLRTHPPRMLFGYPSALAHIAEASVTRGVSLSDLGIKVVFVTAEKCYPYQKTSIEKAFACPVANGYGGRDGGFIAHECPAGSLHISAEDIIVEIVDQNGQVVADENSGEIVVTHMATRDFPFIRYRTGDIATRSSTLCACGRGLPILKEISGRSTDFIRATDGTLIHGLALIYVMRELEGIRSFKIVQESISDVRVLIVPDEGFRADANQAVIDGFRKRLGEDMNVLVDSVNDIPPEKSGKYRYVVNQIDA